MERGPKQVTLQPTEEWWVDPTVDGAPCDGGRAGVRANDGVSQPEASQPITRTLGVGCAQRDGNSAKRRAPEVVLNRAVVVMRGNAELELITQDKLARDESIARGDVEGIGRSVVCLGIIFFFGWNFVATRIHNLCVT